MPKSHRPRARFSFSPTVRALLLAAAACGVALPALAAIEHEEVDKLMQAGKLDEAMNKADAFLKDKPRDPQMRFLKGVIQLDTGKRAEAIAAFTQLTQDAPELPEPYNNLAVIYASQNQFDKARARSKAPFAPTPATPPPRKTSATCMHGWPARPTARPCSSTRTTPPCSPSWP
jgi:tetratricopeptide (TPR) repeat protein